MMDQLLNGLMSLGTVGVFIGLALAGLFAWVVSEGKAKADADGEAQRERERERERAEQNEVHTLPFEEGDDAP